MKHHGRATFSAIFCLCFLLALTRIEAHAGLDAANPIGFFTNVASRLLKAEMNLDLMRIQIWPTNQFTPAVHRLLQVSANLYEATTNRFDDGYPHLPTVFRPQFTNDNGRLYICAYVEETNAAFLSNPLRDVVDTNSAYEVQRDDLVFGVPVVMGAKKGSPNFNEFAMDTVLQLTRKVELVKSVPGGGNTIAQTNQMLILGISNVFGAEFWNSYSNSYPRPVEVLVTNFHSWKLTNDYTFSTQTNFVAWGQLETNSWPGWAGQAGGASFLMPMFVNQTVLPDSVYRQSTDQFIPITNVFERPSGPIFPRWGLTISNGLIAAIIDRESGRVIDCVFLKFAAHHDLARQLGQPETAIGFNGIWGTNAPVGWGGKLSDQPGIIQQLDISKGDVEIGGDWQAYGLNQLSGAARNQAIANFLAYFQSSHTYVYQPGDGKTYVGTNSSLVALTPFTPTAKWSIPAVWQVNDPLINSTASDFTYLRLGGPIGTNQFFQEPATALVPPSATSNTVANLGRVNERYKPWGNTFSSFADPHSFELAIKDPLVRSSDNWGFPAAEELSVSALARTHRGTPWQTLYFKSAGIDLISWIAWSGNLSNANALRSMPTNDWPIIARLALLLNTDASHDLLSINGQNTNVWRATLDGIVVLTNTVANANLTNGAIPQFDSIVIASNSPQAATIANRIRIFRDAQPGDRFDYAGRLLAEPQFSVTAPWLNRSSANQLQRGISDAAYEALPAQLLSRVKPESIGIIRKTSAGGFVIFTGYTGYTYMVEGSTDLTNWTPMSTNVPVPIFFNFTVNLPTVSQPPLRFYRSVVVP